MADSPEFLKPRSLPDVVSDVAPSVRGGSLLLTPLIAAMPLEKLSAPFMPSHIALRSSKISRLGLLKRE